MVALPARPLAVGALGDEAPTTRLQPHRLAHASQDRWAPFMARSGVGVVHVAALSWVEGAGVVLVTLGWTEQKQRTRL